MDKEYCLLQKCKWVMTGRPCVLPCMAPDRRLLVSGEHGINQAICERVHNRERSKRAEEGQDAGLSATQKQPILLTDDTVQTSVGHGKRL